MAPRENKKRGLQVGNKKEKGNAPRYIQVPFAPSFVLTSEEAKEKKKESRQAARLLLGASNSQFEGKCTHKKEKDTDTQDSKKRRAAGSNDIKAPLGFFKGKRQPERELYSN